MSGGGGGGGGGGASSLDNNNNTNALSHYESNSNGGGGYLGNAFGIGSASGSAAEEYALVKVDYDMPNSGGYGGWTGDSVQGSNAGVFSMWND